ncbi:hypothetical protein C7B71_04685 [Bacillus halotolerans]|nr:hypothetical protein C7B71_04685 [Bacillus halotolerans]
MIPVLLPYIVYPLLLFKSVTYFLIANHHIMRKAFIQYCITPPKGGVSWIINFLRTLKRKQA